MADLIPFVMFLVACLVLMAGYPVAFSLAGTALLFALVGTVTGHFDMAFLQALPNRLFGTMENTTLIAVPLFILMGVMLEKSRLSEDLLESMADSIWRFSQRVGYFGCLSRCFISCQYGYCWGNRCHYGANVTPYYAKARLLPRAVYWLDRCNGYFGSDYSTIYCFECCWGIPCLAPINKRN